MAENDKRNPTYLDKIQEEILKEYIKERAEIWDKIWDAYSIKIDEIIKAEHETK